MLEFFRKKHIWPIGLDMAPDGIRMLQLQSADSRLMVRAGAQWKSASPGEHDPFAHQAAAKAVGEILDSGPFHGRRVVASVPMDDIHVRTLRVPEMGPEELLCTIQAKAHEAFDFDLSVSKLLALQAGHVILGDDSCREIILLAVPNYAIRRRQDWLEDLGLKVEHLDVEPLALFRAFRRLRRRNTDRNRISAVAEVSRSGCLVLVAQGRHLLFLKHIARGQDDLTRSAAEQLGLSFEDADQLRRQIMTDYAEQTRDMRMPEPDRALDETRDSIWWTVHDAVRAEADKLVNDIGLCLRYCSTTFGCPQIETLTLTGSGAWDPSLVVLLSDRLGLHCQGAGPLHDVDTSHCPLFGDRRTVLSDWTRCMGLASWAVAQSSHGSPETLLGNELCFGQEELA